MINLEEKKKKKIIKYRKLSVFNQSLMLMLKSELYTYENK